jgi:hypothetical protein
MWPVRAKAPRRAGLSLRSRIAARLGERDRYLDASPMMRDCDVASLGSPPAVVFRRTRRYEVGQVERQTVEFGIEIGGPRPDVGVDLSVFRGD